MALSVVSTTSLESVTGRGEISREDAKDGRAAIILLTNWTINVRAASIFPFSRYLCTKEVQPRRDSFEGKGYRRKGTTESKVSWYTTDGGPFHHQLCKETSTIPLS